ncbi:ATP-grasp domain-containing protein [Candidatus Dependentiae bacterium]|nr:ATP-grasp domain-containing protein [Candidatus Dependentiae bacterium]MCG2756638.1 ATP-grasp domain-containing protein [Candidatus Dependentiae bacterium]
MKKINKILIANRSEIASRIIFTCKTLNIKTASIYSKEDIKLQYIYESDENHELSKCGASAYLEQDEIINIAKKLNADAIHPGYGFLSENYTFAQKVIDSGLIWIGPNPEIIKSMGDKINARNLMLSANIPVIPGYFITHATNQKDIEKIANLISFPLILKDPLGGGGKAIKKVFNFDELIPAINTVKSESSRLTKSNQILIEKYIENGRHIEVQIAGDGKNFIHFYERECSIQRRHQKIIEETPCKFVSQQILNKIYEAAINAAKIISYKNIGTVEFIVTPDEKFYFLEINTRLQVEHSITEETTGIDLVALQINLAQNNKLNLNQNDISREKHAIECRIYSEDPNNNFLPNTGIIKNLMLPHLPFARIDHNLENNQEISTLFDPMIAKITCWGKDRTIAIKNLLTVLKQFNIDGISNNINFLINILENKKFQAGEINTQFVEKFITENQPNFDNKINININENLTEEEIAAIFYELKTKQNLNNKILHAINNWKVKQWR